MKYFRQLKNSIKTILESETQSAIVVIVLISLFCLVNIFSGFNWGLYLIAMLCGFFVSVKNPRSGLYAIIFLTIVFEKFFALEAISLNGMLIKIYPLDIIFLASLLGMFWGYAFSEKKIILSLPEKILGAFMLLNLIYFPLAHFQNSEMALSFSTLKNYVFYPLFYILIYGLIKNKANLLKVFQFFLAGATTIIIFFLIGLVRQKGLWTEFTPLSTDGVRLLAFSHGLFMSLALIPTFLYLTFYQDKKKIWFYVIFLLWIGGIFGTLMRHLWISLFISLLAVFLIATWQSKKSIFKTGLKLLVPVLLMIALVSYWPSLISKLQNHNAQVSNMVMERTQSVASGSEDSSFYWRSVAWRAGLQRFKENPLFGIGTGKRVIVEMKWLTQNVEVRSIHNSYLSIMIQFGLLGLILFSAFIISLLLKLWKLRNNFSALASVSALVFFLVAMVFQPYLETNFLALFFWITLGVIKALPEMEK